MVRLDELLAERPVARGEVEGAYSQATDPSRGQDADLSSIDEGAITFPDPVQPDEQTPFVRFDVVLVGFRDGGQQRCVVGRPDRLGDPGQLLWPAGLPIPDDRVAGGCPAHTRPGYCGSRAAKLVILRTTPLALRNFSGSGRRCGSGSRFSRSLSATTSGFPRAMDVAAFR